MDIRRQIDVPFTMVICGEFKRGKSSLINAILGEDVVTTDVTTETITLNKISYGEHSNALVLDNGKRMMLTDKQLCKENLEKILSAHEKKSYQLEIKRPIDFLKKVTIIDTPGLDDSLQDFTPLVKEALMQADAVVYVFSAIYPLSRQEQMFLRSCILPQKHTDLFLVANYVDMLQNAEQYSRMAEEIFSRTENIFAGKEVYMLSALDERRMQLGEERPAEGLEIVLAENFREFRENIFSLVEQKCDMVLPDRIERLFAGMRSEIGTMIEAVEKGLLFGENEQIEEQQKAQKESEQLHLKRNETTDEIKHDIEAMKEDTIIWLRELISKMRLEAGSIEKFDLNDVRKYYSLYCIDTLRDAMERCTDYHTEMIYDKLDDISEDLSKELSLAFVANTKQQFRFNMHNKTWTQGDNVSFVLDQVGLGSSIIGMFAKGFAGNMREKEIANKKEDIYSDIRAQYVNLDASVSKIVEEVYCEISEKVSQQIQEYFDEREREIEDRMSQILNTARKSTEEKEEVRRAVNAVKAMLKSDK